jgi:prophage regulatory protein
MSNVIVAYPQLRERGIPFSRVHLRRLIAAGDFPPPVQLGPHSIGWLAHEIDAWLDARADARSADAATPKSRAAA